MYESRIAADPVTVAASPGFSPEIDALAARSPQSRLVRVPADG